MVSFKIGNGNKVHFWEDKWLGDYTLEETFPSLFRLSSFKSRPISDFVDAPRLLLKGTTSWNFHFPRNLLDREIEHVQDLLNKLESLSLCPRVGCVLL